MESLEPHVYSRSGEIDIDNSSDSLAVIARQTEPGSEVLELGVATGYFSRFLVEKLGCTVDGAELDPVMAGQAGRWCRRLVVMDLERERLAGNFDAGAYGTVVCADVLEHLEDPAPVLRELGEMLKPGGRVIASIPNAAYAGVILDLIEGDFLYRDEGLLDRTHLRLYTRSGFEELLRTLGYVIEGIETVPLPLEASEFFERLNHLAVPLKNYFYSLPGADAYQYVFTATPPQAAT